MSTDTRSCRLGVIVVMLALLLGLALPEFVWAQAVPTTPTPAVVSKCADFAGVTNRVAGCVLQTVDASAQRFFIDIYPAVSKAIFAVMTLAVIVYGVAMTFGMVESFGRDSMILLFKTIAVIWLSGNSPYLYDKITEMMNETGAAIVNYTPPTGTAYKDDKGPVDFGQGVCLKNMREEQAKAPSNKPVVGPWLGIDCILDSVLGIKLPTTDAAITATAQKYYNGTLTDTNNNTGARRGYVFMFFAAAQTSVMGLLLAVMGIVFVWGLLILIVKAFFMYVAGMIGVALMIIVSPFIIPMLLFRATKSYFDKWFKVTLSLAVQPLVTLVFIIFVLTAIDFAAFSGKHSIMYRMAGEAIHSGSFDINAYLKEGENPIIVDYNKTLARVKGAQPVTPIGIVDDAEGGVFSQMKSTVCTGQNTETDANLKFLCDFFYPQWIGTQYLDWQRLAAARTDPPVVLSGGSVTPGQQIAREVLAATVFCALVVFVLNGLLAVVPFIAYDLMGDFAQSPNLGAIASFHGAGGRALGSANKATEGVANQIKTLVGLRT